MHEVRQSDPRSISKWATADAVGAFRFARDQYAAAPVLLAHSFAGQALGIAEELHEARAAELFDRMAEVIDMGAGPRGLIEQGIEETVRFFCERPSYLRMHLQDRTAWGLSEQGTDVQSESWQRGRELIRQAFLAGIRDGTFHEGDPEGNARMVMAMHQVKLAEWVAVEPRPALEDIARDLKLLFRRAFVKGAATSA